MKYFMNNLDEIIETRDWICRMHSTTMEAIDIHLAKSIEELKAKGECSDKRKKLIMARLYKEKLSLDSLFYEAHGIRVVKEY